MWLARRLVGTPSVLETEAGEVEQLPDRLVWRIPNLAATPEGSLDVTATLTEEQSGEPISVGISARTLLSGVSILEVYSLEDGTPVPFAQSTSFGCPPGSVVFGS